MYHVYHIPGKKVGVTNNPSKRIEQQQGYKPEEYHIVYSTDDISVASIMEKELQIAYGYKVDQVLYENLTINKKEEMKINVTEQTTTFNCPVNKLKGRLMDNKQLSWETSYGFVELNDDLIKWIMSNVISSQFDVNRSFVYNKAMAEFLSSNEQGNIACDECGDNIFDCIRLWARDRGLYDKGDPKTQYIKLMEEAGEVGRALLKEDTEEIIDGIGDMVVVLTNLAELNGVSIEKCIQEAYDVISKRSGKMINGTFVKDN